MAARGSTVRTDTGGIYRLEERLGDGRIAAVWRAVAESGERADREVAVKVAHPALSRSLRARFDSEHDTLKGLLEAGRNSWPTNQTQPLVPAFAEVATLEPEGREALVTELVEAPTLPELAYDEDNLFDRQALLVEPAYQYAWLLDFLHNQVSIGQSDRKLDDLHWDAERRRLIVLDWNVVEEGAGRAPEDVYKFGEMWYALLLGVTPIVGGDVAAAKGWEALSAAWRTLLRACLRPNRDARPTSQQLLRMTKARWDAFQQPAEALYGDGQQALEQAQTEPRQAERAWWLLDLAWRQGSEKAEPLAREAEALFQERGQRLLENVKSNLRLGASSRAEEALREAESEIGEDPELRLQVVRWRVLVDAAVQAREERNASDFRNVAPLLIEAVGTLQADEWSEAEQLLASALDKLPDEAAKARVEDLQREVDLHQSLMRAVELREEQRWTEAAEAYEAAERPLAAIRYRDSLAPLIVDLVHEQKVCEQLDKTEGKLQEIQGQLPDLMEDGEYVRVQTLCNEGLPLTRGKAELRRELKDTRALAHDLERLRQARQRAGETAESLTAQARDLMAAYPGQSAVCREVRQTVIRSLPELKQRAESPGTIDSIENALSLGRDLEELGRSAGVPQPDRERASQAVGRLERKAAQYRDTTRQLQKKGEEQTKSLAQVVAEAEQDGVQLFKDRELSEEIREADLVETIVKEYKDKRAEWQQLSDEIRGLRERFREALKDVRDMETQTSEAERLKIQERIDWLARSADRVSNYREMLDELEEVDTLKEEAAERAKALREGLLQQQLSVAINALRWFRPDRAAEHLQKAQALLSGHPDLAEAYDDPISLAALEREIQSQWGDDRRQELSGWRKMIQDGESLGESDIQKLNSLASETNSVSVIALWQLQQPEPSPTEAATGDKYQEDQMRAHLSLSRLLKEKELENLEKELKTFTDRWEKTGIEKHAPGWVVRHREFVCAWSNRLIQARVLHRAIEDLRTFNAWISEPKGPGHYTCVVKVSYVESITNHAPAEVLYAYAEDWGAEVQSLVDAIRQRSRYGHGLDLEMVKGLQLDLRKRIEERRVQGEYFFSVLPGRLTREE